MQYHSERKTKGKFAGITLQFRDELPKSTVGKLLRRVLADEEREKMDTGAAEPPSPS